MPKFYLTTTLPYVNAAPHIGHALEFFQADAIVRHKRKQLGKENVFFNVGMDEHGLKIYQKAQAENKTPQEYADGNANNWVEFCKTFNISYDNFYRTTDPAHYKAAQAFWKKCDEAGDIYKKKYEGLYCVGCEEFKTEKDLVDGKCPLHNIEPIKYSEENYFFKLSKYREQLLEYYQSNRDKLKPDFKFDELINFIQGMEDISISRLKKNLPWGITVPGDDEQVMYVWFDALTNYANAVGFSTDEERFNEWWPSATQIFGPDNLRFQCAIWQGMLLSA
ncbi:MAG: methionine--tRNA ligase, partial [Candidatus Dojkabacteria bacterium]